jgi:outer membrane protein assembly factor BamB
MKKLLAFLAFLVPAAAALPQDAGLRIHTKPVLPSLETLDRLNLKMAWKVKVPMDGLRDGFVSLQLFPSKDFMLLLGQTNQGATIAINAETGDVLWRTLVGRPYESAKPAAVNNQTVFVCRREYLYAIDSESGKQMLYTAEQGTTVPAYGMALEGAPSAGLVADNDHLFITQVDRVIRYEVPHFRSEYKSRPPPTAGKLQDSPQVVREWAYRVIGETVVQTPILRNNHLIITTGEGSVVVIDKYKGEEVTHFRAEGGILGTTAINKSVAYIASEDYFLYAFDTASGKLMWRFPGQAQITRSPQATDKDVYVSPAKAGMIRVDRVTGEPRWNSKEAVTFLAANKRFVYTMDRLGQVQVLDYDRGKELARWDTRDWTMPISNTLTDRIYLAANDGQIICLHHRDQVKPLKMSTSEDVQAPPKKKEVDKDEKKDDTKDMKDDAKKAKDMSKALRPAACSLGEELICAATVPAVCDFAHTRCRKWLAACS